MLYLPNIIIRTIQIKKKNDNRRIRHYLSWLVKQKGYIFIDNKSEVHVFKKYIYIYIDKNSKHNEKINTLQKIKS